MKQLKRHRDLRTEFSPKTETVQRNQFTDQRESSVVQQKQQRLMASHFRGLLQRQASGVSAEDEKIAQQAPKPKSGALPSDPAAASDVNRRALAVEKSINTLISKNPDSATLELGIKQLEEQYQLKNISLENIGKTNPKIVFQINPTYEVIIQSGATIGYRMLGSGTGENTQTNVLFKTGNMTLGSTSAIVGNDMIANPLSQDHQPGSDSNKDSDQDTLMSKLGGAGNTSLPNHSKYIKGHLLNHDVGGPGNAINLYPITADANDKHLKFVEKWVKASVQAGFVCYYRVWVSGESIQALGSSKYQVNSDFNFDFFRYSIDGNPVPGSRHQGAIQSRYQLYGEKPYSIPDEFNQSGQPEASTLNEAKGTPKAKGLGGESSKKISGYTLKHPAGKGFSTTAQTSKALPSIYGGSSVRGFLGLTLAHSKYGGEANEVGSFSGRFIVQSTGPAQKAERTNWIPVRVYLANNQSIELGTTAWMRDSWFERGQEYSSSVMWSAPLNLTDSIGGINSGAIETFWGGGGVLPTGKEYQNWAEVNVVCSLDERLPLGINAWMKKSWLESE